MSAAVRYYSRSGNTRAVAEAIAAAVGVAAVSVESETFYVKNRPNAGQLKQAGAFAEKFLG